MYKEREIYETSKGRKQKEILTPVNPRQTINRINKIGLKNYKNVSMFSVEFGECSA